ncbi:MAG: flagellar motor switch protein FliM [Caldimicrobium sp.]
MEKILSQEEIDALLAGLETGKVDITPKKEEPGQVKPFDFRDFTISTKLKIPGFDVINDYLTRSLRLGLSTLLREIVEITSLPTQMERFKDFLQKIPVPTSIHIFRIDPLKGYSLLIIDAPLVFLFVERFLGGGERKSIRVEGREFTPIEQRLIKKVVNLILDELEKAWRNISPIKPKYIRGEVNPQFARVLQPEETVLIAGFLLELEQLSGKILFCYALSSLQPIKDKLYAPYQVEEVVDIKWKKALEEIILNSEVRLRALLGKGQITIGDLIHLKKGDIIVLDKKGKDPIEVLVEDVPKILGRMGVYKKHLAVQIESLIKPQEGN